MTKHAQAALAGCYVISLRPVARHAGLRAAAARHGARVLALSPFRIEHRDDAATQRALQQALRADIAIITSPEAVRAAAALAPLRTRRGQRWCAVGSGSAAALRRAGIRNVDAPVRMDSEGLLALPALQQVRGLRIALVTAPGGRDRIAPALRARGAQVQRVDVYARVPVTLRAAALRRFTTMRAPCWLALSSGEALESFMSMLDATQRRHLLRARVAAASERLATLARDAGFLHVVVAQGPRPAQLLQAMTAATPRAR